jgi:hypothetical protein
MLVMLDKTAGILLFFFSSILSLFLSTCILGYMDGVYLFSYVANGSQHTQYIQKPICVVLSLQGPAAVAFW